MATLLVLVSTAEGVAAAVQSGADAVAAQVALPGREGLGYDELFGAARFCRVRGVKLYAELDCRLTDAALEEAVISARRAWLAGCDGLIVGDPGLILSLRRTVPDAPLTAGYLMQLDAAEGLEVAAAMGAKQALLSPFLSQKTLDALLQKPRIGLIPTLHGRLTAAFPGFDLAAEPNARSGVKDTRKLEAETASLRPFALPDLCLLEHLEALSRLPLAALALDGRNRRPEYVSAMTWLYARPLSTKKDPDWEELNVLNNIDPAPSFTDAFFTGKRELELSGAPAAPPAESDLFLQSLRKGYLRREFQRVPVRFIAEASLGKPFRLAAEDDRGNLAVTEGGKTELAFHRELTATTLQTELFRTGGTPFLCADVRCRIPPGVTVSTADIAADRDRLLKELMERRAAAPERSARDYVPSPRLVNRADTPVLTVSVRRLDQLSQTLLELMPPVIYVPLMELQEGAPKLASWLGREGMEVTAVLPPVSPPDALPELTARLLGARQLGIETVEVSNLGQALFCRRLGFRVRGGLGLGIRGSGALEALRAFGFASVTLSPVLSAAEVTALSKALPTELVVYGRLPLLTAPNFTVKGHTGPYYDALSSVPDDNGFAMPLTTTPEATVLWSARKLFLARRSRDTMRAGLWGVRLGFTTENADECARVAERFLGHGSYFPANFTTGAF